MGVGPWESAIQRSKKRYLDRDGSMKLRNKGGHSGESYCIACSAAQFAGPQEKLQRLNECYARSISNHAVEVRSSKATDNVARSPAKKLQNGRRFDFQNGVHGDIARGIPHCDRDRP